jgi:glycosyltransferase involved in cell wall biosynthesis
VKIAITADPELPVPPELYGGIERIIDLLIKGLMKRGHEVTLFSHPASLVQCNKVSWKRDSSTGFSNIISNAATLSLHIIKGNFDVVHSFSRLAYLMPLLPFRIPKIMSYQREPTISQIKSAVKIAYKDSLLFTGCSNYITNKIKKAGDAVTVYNCVSTENYKYSEEVKEDAPLVFLGRIEAIKGPHLAIQTAIKANRKLIIAGNIPKEGESYFHEKIQPFLNESIIYIGAVNDKQKNEVLNNAAALLMPIQWNEPFGIVMIEAMACGTPVIGYPFGAVREVIQDGINGFICSTIDEMVYKIGNVSSIKRMNVRSIVEQQFSDTIIVDKYLSAYKSFEKVKLNLVF